MGLYQSLRDWRILIAHSHVRILGRGGSAFDYASRGLPSGYSSSNSFFNLTFVAIPISTY